VSRPLPPDDGGPAFPVPPAIDPSADVCVATEGMSLRDYFAGQVVVGLLAKYGWFDDKGGAIDEPTLALFAYEVADAMLDERDKPTEG
jgi:hypothetical protein